MDSTITIGDAGLIIIGLSLIVLIFYCIFLVKNLIPAAKTLNRILEDTERITSTAADGVEVAQRTVSDISGSVAAITDSIKGHEGHLQGALSFVHSLSTLIGFLNKKKD